MFFEIYQKHTLVKRGDEILNEPSWDVELMQVPSMTLTLPITYLDYIQGREEFKLFVNDKCFWGIVKDHDVNKAEETIDIQLEHVVSEWEYRQISVNHAMQDGKLNVVYKGEDVTKNKANGETITASNFKITRKQFEKASDAFLIEKAYARAWNTSNGANVKIADVDEVLVEDKSSSSSKTTATTQSNNITVSTKGQAVVEYAKKFIGTPYVWGGESLTRGVDCSGFTMMVYRHFGINLPHYSDSQLNYGRAVTNRNDVQPGDLVIYPGHVAMIVDKNHIIHSSRGGVHIRSNPWYLRVKGIRRLIGTSADKSKTRHYSDSGYGSKTLNGTTHPAIFTAYYPANDSMQGGFMAANGEKLDPSKNTCAAPTQIKFNTNIQIKTCEGKSSYVGKIYRVNDRGGAIIIDGDGNYHIDLLMRTKSQAYNFGRRKGSIIVADGTGYHYSGSSNSTKSSSDTYKVTFKTAKGTSVTVEMTVGDEEGSDSPSEASVIDNIGDIFNDFNFAYPGWQIDYQDDSANRMIDYVYSRQNKLEALTKTMELTDDLWWRVGFVNEKLIQVGKFGKQKNYTLSLRPSGQMNRRIIEEPTIDYDYENVINVATVYSEKSDTGMASMTMREVYTNPDLQKAGFPVVIIRANANNERDYHKYVNSYFSDEFTSLAPNGDLEYAVLDEESIALEAGELIEGTYAFTDLAPFNDEGKKIKKKQRVDAAKTAYAAAIRKLKQARRSHTVKLTVEELPVDLWVGDKVRLLYTNTLWNLDACSNYMKKILTMDDWYYLTRIGYSVSKGEVVIDEIELSKYLKHDREISNES